MEEKKTTKKKKVYESKLATTSIRCTSKATIKIRDNFYSVEMSEERVCPEGTNGVDWSAEKKFLWDDVNDQIDKQVEDIYKYFLKEKSM